MTAADLLTVLWLMGIAAMAVWFLVTNLRFWQKLRRTRAPSAAENCRYPVYLVEAGPPSPCLFGLLRAAQSVLPPPLSPLRSGCGMCWPMRPPTPAIWTRCGRCCGACASRCTGSTLWVWIAAAVSKADGELACDEAAIQALGEGERYPLRQNAAVPDSGADGSRLSPAVRHHHDGR